MRRPRVLDLFAGAGGLAAGFRAAGFSVAAGTDIDPDAAATFNLNFPAAATVCGDLRDPEVKERVLDAGCGVQVVVGGPPCQAFSQVRNHARLIEDPRNSLYREFVGVVGSVLPKVFVMENVPGLEQVGAKSQILEDLALDGEYAVAAQVLDAADFGVPQSRQRIIFVGLHRSLGAEPPSITGTGATSALGLARRNGSYPVRYAVEAQREWLARLRDADDATVVTAEQALSDLAHLRAGTANDELPVGALPEPRSVYQARMRENLRFVLANTSVPRINADTVLRLNGIPKGGNHRDLPPELLDRYLTGARWGPDAGNGKLSRRHYYAYRRLHPGFWSWTLNTKADSVYHYRAARALSVREFARLQSFSDDFVFTTDPRRGPLPGRIDGGAGHSRYRQVGNAVPPLLAEAVARAVRRFASR